jgi:hypothetical protein
VRGRIEVLKVIEDGAAVKGTQTLFLEKLRKGAEKRGVVEIGYRGGNARLEASWSKKLGIWWASEEFENRYWNAFGTHEPRWNSKYSHTITCEINPPLKGINRTISGAFADDSDGRGYLLHRGKIGGGREGIGKTRFWNEFRGEWLEVEDGEVISKLALIASFDSPRFAEQIANFVHEVERIKTMTVSAERTTSGWDSVFKEEFYGKKKASTVNIQVQALCDHGLVVNTLAGNLENAGLAVGNSPNVDLFTIDETGNPNILFEIKTDTMRTQCYEAVGQLFFHSAKLQKKPRLVAVFPNHIDKEFKGIIEKLNIYCLTYTWIDNKPHFAEDSKLGSLIMH